jgi:hypothetical protein
VTSGATTTVPPKTRSQAYRTGYAWDAATSTPPRKRSQSWHNATPARWFFARYVFMIGEWRRFAAHTSAVTAPHAPVKPRTRVTTRKPVCGCQTVTAADQTTAAAAAVTRPPAPARHPAILAAFSTGAAAIFAVPCLAGGTAPHPSCRPIPVRRFARLPLPRGSRGLFSRWGGGYP